MSELEVRYTGDYRFLSRGFIEHGVQTLRKEDG